MRKAIKKNYKRLTSMFLTALLLVGTVLPSSMVGKVSAAKADHIVISQVFGGGGNSGAPYNKDFVELYNPTDQPVSVEGWTFQYASNTGAWSGSTKLAGTIPAHGFYLITQAGGSVGVELPTADASGTITMSGTNGKVRIIDNAETPNVIDFVGFGSATTFEGSGPTKALSNTTSAQRRPYANVNPSPGNGNAWDTDDNVSDFFVGNVTKPRNTASPAEAPMESNVSLQAIGNKMQFTQQDTTVKLTGTVGAAPTTSVIKVYESAAKGTTLATKTVAEDGSFSLEFTSQTALTSLYVSATQEGKEESDAIEIALAKPSNSIVQDKLSYSVDKDGKGTLIGSPGAGVAKSIINVYPNESAVQTERLNTTQEEVLGTGAFSAITFDNAPNTVYVTQQSNTSKGIMLESVPVSVTKADTDTVTPLNEVKATDDRGILKNLNGFFTIEGIVTIQNGILGTQKNNFYIQDATGGINVFGSYDSGLTVQRGDKLKVTGKVIVYNGMTEFEPSIITKIDEGNALPIAKDISILDLNTFTVAEPLEGSLVKVSGKISAVAVTGTNYNVTIVDENNKTTTLRVMEKTGIKPDTDLVIGKSYAVTGIVGQYTTNATHVNGYQVFPRDVKDISAQLSLEHTAITQAYEDANIEFVATASGAESVTLYYRALGTTDYTAVTMTASSEGRYTSVLNASAVPGGFEYYIEAKAGEKLVNSGSKEAPHAVSVIADKEGPRFFGETPVGGSKSESPRPEISILVEDPSGVDETSIKVEFDGSEIDYTKASISKSQIKFTPENDLELKVHTIKVTAKDVKNNETVYEWAFESVPRFTGGNHYRGTTHNHTNISHDGAGTPEDALKAGKKYNYDWFAFSDHSHDIDPTLLGQDTVDHKGMQERKGGADWQTTKDLATQYTKNGDYVVFPAFEMTSTTWGHSNIFGSENFIDRNINGKQYQDLNNYYAWVMTYDDIVGQFNHPDMSKDAFNNFKPYNQGVDKLFTMLEVGNGSGHYGYANAEKKFFSVLDLGWHVAPTYGEDNHEGTWGQTRARTVIVADDLSQESLLHSMRNMRVYMVEDPNFTLDVLANGYYMGSTVDSKDLKFKISGSDLVAESPSMEDYNYLPSSYKSDDKIAKVELISNGGTVVDSITPNTTDFTWEPSYKVTGGQQWFVVKVTQADGEQMYSAPIWSKEEAVDVKVNGIDVVGDVIIEGNPATIKANVSNNGTQEVKNLKVDLYYDEVKEASLIGTSNLSSIVSKGVGTATFTWNSPIKGDHKLIAVVTSLDNLDLGDTKFTLPVEVKEPLGIKVLIDAKHNNENTSTDGGTYANNLKSFTTLLQKEGYTVSENKEVITDAVLSAIQVLVITHPKAVFTAEEKAAIAKFVKNGGSLLMAGKSNNSTDPTVNNDMLSDIGTAIRMGNDGVFDDSKEGNFWSDPKVSPFAVRLHPGLVSNYITDRVSFIDYYSGTSLSGANNQPLTESGKVVILAKGNETTYQGNIKTGGYTYDAVSDTTGGSQIPMIASEEIGEKGRIIVSGMNIFNDKQIDESYEPKGNDEFSLNAINWLAHRETKITSIGDARKLAEETETVIEGTVTTGAGVFFDAFYLQDETGGIMAFQEVPAGSIKPGDKVRVYGHIISFDNNKEIEFGKFENDVIILSKNGDPIQPKLVETGQATSTENQGLLVKVKGKVVSKFDDNSYVINDGSGDTLVFTDGYIVNQSGPVPVLKKGDTLEAVGLSGSFAQGERIRVRDTKELIGTDTSAPDAPTVNAISENDMVITGTAEAGSTVIATVNGTEIGRTTADAEGKFTMDIAKQAVGVKIVVTATDALEHVGEATEVVVADATAPTAPSVNAVTDADGVLTGTAEAGSTVVATVNGTEIGRATADAEGKFTMDIAKQAAGTKISVTAEDTTKNVSGVTEVVVTDATAPAAPTVNAVTDADVVLTGTAEAGSTVVASVNGTEIGRTTADAEGKFIMDIAKQVAGAKISVTAEDTSENVSGVTEVVVTDATAPAAPTVNAVTDADVVLTGTAEAGSTVVATVNGTEIGRATADAEGKFTMDIAKQVAGTKISVTAEDTTKNVSGVTEVVVTDATAPVAPTVNVVTDADVVLTGTSEAGSIVVASVNGTEIGRTTADAEGKFTMDIAKQVAGAKISVTAEDTSENVSGVREVVVTDATAPAAPTVNAVTDADVVLTGTAEAGSTVVATVNGTEIGSVTADPEGKFTMDIAKQAAGAKISVTAEDASENVSSSTQVTVTAKVILKHGWVKEDGKWFFYDEKGQRKTGWLQDGAKWYYLDQDGAMKENTWIQGKGTWYYVNAKGEMVTNEWVQSSGKWYYFGTDGKMTVDAWVSSKGKWYYFGSDGKMLTNAWQLSKGKWFYLGSDGKMLTNAWVSSKGKWFYLGSKGEMVVSNWVYSGGKWYFMNAKGEMMTSSWLFNGGSWYYMDSKGVMKTGWFYIGGKWYYFYANGKMAANTTIQGYKLGANGARIK